MKPSLFSRIVVAASCYGYACHRQGMGRHERSKAQIKNLRKTSLSLLKTLGKSFFFSYAITQI
jgi:hypothetical protein